MRLDNVNVRVKNKQTPDTINNLSTLIRVVDDPRMNSGFTAQHTLGHPQAAELEGGSPKLPASVEQDREIVRFEM